MICEIAARSAAVGLVRNGKYVPFHTWPIERARETHSGTEKFVIMAVGGLYFAWRNRDFRKFLTGAFFVSSGILFYLYLADVSVPLLGTSFIETPQISGGRSIVHFLLYPEAKGLNESRRASATREVGFLTRGKKCHMAIRRSALQSDGVGVWLLI